MLLPNAERAIIDLPKLRDNWRDLEAALRAQHLTQPAVAEPLEALGQPFTIRAILKGPASSALVTSV